MAGDPLYDVTPVFIKGQVWYDTTSTTDATYPTGYARSGYVVVTRVSSKEDEEKEKKRKKWFMHQALVLAMKQQWRDDNQILKPVPVLKPDGQLRGVCFGGRGWA